MLESWRRLDKFTWICLLQQTLNTCYENTNFVHSHWQLFLILTMVSMYATRNQSQMKILR